MANDKYQDPDDSKVELDQHTNREAPADLGKTQSHDPENPAGRNFSADRPGAHGPEKDQVIGPYRLVQRIGSGGMGEVWMADQSKPFKRRVALKLIKSGIGSKEIISRFDAERQALALMNHPNIARILDAGTTDEGQPYFVMELVTGVPLTTYCDQNRLSIDDRLKLFTDVCSGVQHAHQKGIIHRDLKPGNIIVGMQDGKAVPKIIDFGLAKAMESTQRLTDQSLFTGIGQILGTLKYMSPEQASLDLVDIDTRTDIYVLGVILYELLTGSTPLDDSSIKGQAALKILKFIREKEPVKPSSRLGSSTDAEVSAIAGQRKTDSVHLSRILVGELDWIVMKALEKDRTRRYESASGFAADVERYLQGDMVLARPPSTAYRLRKYVNKNKGLVASLVAIATLLIAATIGTSWFGFQANEARKNADLKTLEVIVEKQNVERERDRANENESKVLEALEQTESTLARSNYFLAVARWDANRVSEANELLDLVPSKYRNFEWHLARRQFVGGYMTCYGHTKGVTSVRFSPDGKKIASSSEDGTIRLWDAVTGEVLRILNDDFTNVNSLCFSPDGKRIASGTSSNVKLWDAVNGMELQTLEGHGLGVFWVEFSPGGSRIVSGGNDNTIKVWDAATGEQVHSLTCSNYGSSTAVCFSPDGSQIVSGFYPDTFSLWNASTGQHQRSLIGHANIVRCLGYSPDGMRIVSGSYDKAIKVWDAASGKVLQTLTGHTGHVLSVSFSPGGVLIVSGSDDNTIRLWSAAAGEELRTLKGHTDSVNSVSFSPDGKRIVSGSEDKTLKIWDVTTGEELQAFKVRTRSGGGLSVSPNGKWVVSGSVDNTIRLSDAFTGQVLLTLVGHTGRVDTLSFSPDGKWIVSGSRDNALKLWDAVTGAELRTLKGHTGSIGSVNFSPDGKRIVSGSQDKTVKLWDATIGRELLTLDGHSGIVSGVSFILDGTQIVSGSFDKTLKIWDPVTGEEIRTLEGHPSEVTEVCYSPISKQIISGSADGTCKQWDAVTGDELRTLKSDANPIFHLSISPDGTRIVTGADVQSMTLWDAVTGHELRTLETRVDGFLSGVCFSPDGARILSSMDNTLSIWDATSGDNTLIIWDATSGAELRTLKGHTARVVWVNISPDGSRVYSSATDNNSQYEQFVWDVDTGIRLESAPWKAVDPSNFVSNDGRWLVSWSGDKVLLIDLDFKNRPHEKSIRTSKALLDQVWHKDQANEAAERNDWYAALFHRAWVLKADPENADSFDQLHTAHEELKADFAERNLELEPVLPAVVSEMLQIRRVGDGDQTK